MVGFLASDNTKKNAGKALGFAATLGAGFLGYKLLGNLYENFSRSQAQHLLLDSKEARQAQQLKLAMNPSGFDFLFSFDTTNLPAVFSAAKEIESFNEVRGKYAKLYPGRNLVQDLESELSFEELNRFYGYMQQGQVNNIAMSAKPVDSYSFKVGQRVFANGKPFGFDFPESGAETLQILERNAPLGTVEKRLSTKGDRWYLIGMGNGDSFYFKEAGLL